MPIKVMTVVGTRPEVLKLSRVIAELDRRTTHVLVHTGQNYDYELNEVFFEQLGIRKPDHLLSSAAPTAAETIARVITGCDAVIAREKPDALLILGDTNSCLSAVIAAKRRKVPVFHMEAGNRCFDERVPEEINRRMIDHASDFNLTYTEHARRYLIAEGIRPETLIKTGSPMREVLDYSAAGIRRSRILRTLKVTPGRYLVVSAHREENVDDPRRLRGLLDALDAVATRYRRRIIFSTHPRTRERLASVRRPGRHARIEFVKPLGFHDYVRLQVGAWCVLSDSGTLTEESSILGFPAVMIRQAHERPEGMDEATAIMSDLVPGQLLDAVELAVTHHAERKAPMREIADYAPDNVSKKVVRIILSYTDYVNRTVWRK